MSTYKLTYFNVRARGELPRFVLVQAGVQFEDKRIEFKDWPALKSQTPWGCLPTLEVEGRTLCGSVGIARFLAERHGLAGSNDLDNAELWGIVDAATDLFDDLTKLNWEDETRKAELKKKMKEKVLPQYLANFERQASKNGAPEGWMWGNKVTYADFAVYLALGYMHMVEQDPNVLDNFPTLGKLMKSVETLPNIARWLKERPVSEF